MQFIEVFDNYRGLNKVHKDFTNVVHMDWKSIGYGSLACLYHGYWVLKYFGHTVGTPFPTYIKNALTSLKKPSPTN